MSGTQKPQITFHIEYGPVVPNRKALRKWLANAITAEGNTLGRMAFIFVSDEQLLELNKRHLKHNTLTDILSFPYAYDPVEADIYISVDRIIENATDHKTRKNEELRRVMIHGVLHMCGYSDKTKEEQTEMRAAEDRYLLAWNTQ